MIYSSRALHEGNNSHNHELERPINGAYFYIDEDSSRDARIH